MGKSSVFVLMIGLMISAKTAAQLHLPGTVPKVSLLKNATPLPQNFYNNSLGFFCKKESQLQKVTGVNMFFRLGTKDYVDYLERKPNAPKQY